MKKLGSLLLTLALLLGMAAPAAAAIPSNAKIIDVLEPINYGIDPGLYDLDIKDLGSDRSIYFIMTADMFEWDFEGADLRGEAVTSSHVSRSKLGVGSSNKTGAASSVIESVNITYASGGYNSRTAAVQLKFRAGSATSQTRNFGITLYLTLNGRRQSSSELRIEGSIAPASGSDVYDGDYVDISDGTILQPSSNVRNVELYLGADVTMKTNLNARKKYSGTAGSEVSVSDDKLLDKFPSIENVIVIRQSGLSKSGKYVYINGGYNYYVYNAEHQYIGRSNLALPFSSKYYLSSKSIDMGGGSSGDSSSSTSSQPVKTPTSTGSEIDGNSAVAKAQLALRTNKKAEIEYENMSSVSAATLKAINNAAKNAGGTVDIIADTGAKSVQGRLTIPTANAANLKGSILLGVYVGEDKTGATKTKFTKAYKNKIAVVSLAQQGSYGMAVHVDAKVDLSSFNTSKLYLYSYDKSTNKFQLIKNAGASFDDNGYLHFDTSVGGDIIISEGQLAKK